MAMHHCLSIPELLSIIVDYLGLESSSSGLTCLARACKAFTGDWLLIISGSFTDYLPTAQNPALDILRRDQLALGFLIQVLSFDARVVERDLNVGWMDYLLSQVLIAWNVMRLVLTRSTPKKLTRALEENDWFKLKYYGKRIRHFGFSSIRGRRLRVHESVFTAIETYQPLHMLLPNLRAIQFRRQPSLGSDSLARTALLLNSTITRVALQITGREAYLSTLLSCIPDLCPYIRDLMVSLVEFGGTHNIAPALAQMIGSLRHLRVVDIHPSLSSPDLGSSLCQLPSLRTLKRIELPHDTALFSTRVNEPRFKQLRNFSFRAQSLEHAAELLRCMQCPLESLDIQITTELSEGLDALMKSMAEHCCRNTLHKISVSEPIQLPRVPFRPGVAMARLISALFEFKTLEEVSLLLPDVAGLDDNWLSDAARAWPSLRSLELLSSRHRTTGFTLSGLIPLVRHCPRLHSLTIALVANPIDPMKICGTSNTKIQMLDFSYSLLRCPEKVFRSLTLLFPCLSSAFGYGMSAKDRDAWTKLDNLLKMSVYQGPD